MEERTSVETKALSIKFVVMKGVKEIFNVSCHKYHVFVPNIEIKAPLKSSGHPSPVSADPLYLRY